jgi:UDP-GlcNAc:undecaprenyl-phosphate GlcNAc-1-phosphate transferase
VIPGIPIAVAHYAGAALAAGAVTSLTVPLLVRAALALRAVDRVEPHKPDARRIPRLGGVAMFAGIASACAVGLVVRWDVWSQVIPRQELLALGIGAILVFLVGLVDDLLGTSPWQKFLVQFLAAWLVVSAGWSFAVVRLPGIGRVDLGVWGGILSLVWIVGVTNALNLLDGLDGLAGGVAAIIATSLFAYTLYQGNEGSAILLAAVAGACLGFLWHNWEPAKILMGDSGSLTIGFLFGAITVHSSLKMRAAVAILVPILALGLPVIDTLLVMAMRFARGGGHPLASRVGHMFRGDRSHLHHLLGNIVMKRRSIVRILYVVAALCCVAAALVAIEGDSQVGLALLGLEVAVIVGMRWLGLAAGARRLALAQREAARAELEEWREGVEPLPGKGAPGLTPGS